MLKCFTPKGNFITAYALHITGIFYCSSRVLSDEVCDNGGALCTTISATLE